MLRVFKMIFFKRAFFCSVILSNLLCATAPQKKPEPEKKTTEAKKTAKASDKKEQEKETKPLEKTAQEILQEMENRENPGLSMHHINGPLDINVLSSAEGISEALDKDSHIISIPIGAQTPMECTLNEGNQSPSYITKRIFEKFKSNTELEQVAIKSISAGVLNKIPYLYLETEYHSKAKQYGKVKSISLSSIGFVLTCFHDEPGYQKTFLNAAESLSASPVIQNYLSLVAKYSSRHINLIKINGNISGIMENFVFEADSKSDNYYSITNVVVKGSPTELIAGESVDDVQIEKMTGNVISGKYYSYQNNSEEYQIGLQAEESNKYKISGTHQGRNISQTIEAPSKIMHFEFIANRIASDPKFKMKIQQGGFKFSEYLADDPEKTFQSSILIKSAKDKIVKFSYSSVKAAFKVELDQSGITRVDLDNQTTKISIERVFAQ